MDDWTAYDALLGVIIAAAITGLGWAGKRLLGKDGILESSNKAINSQVQSTNALCSLVQEDRLIDAGHHKDTAKQGETLDRFHAAALQAVNEIEAEGQSRGMDLRERCERVRKVLRGES